MPGFFDVFFGQSEPEPEPAKPKKAKKAKKAKKTEKVKDRESPFMGMIKGMQTRIDELEARTPEPEPEVDESKRDPRGYEIIVKEGSDGEDESD